MSEPVGTDTTVDIDRWGHVIFVTQLIIASSVFVVEVINNTLLYVTRSQGYGPDTIVEKLFRYMFMTTVINFGAIFWGRILMKSSNDAEAKKYIAMIATVVMCTDVAFSHYQFAGTLTITVIPIMASILYEDEKLTRMTLFFCLFGQTLAIIARGVDPGYNKDIGPEAAIAYAFTVSAYIFSTIILNTLEKRRVELSTALIETENARSNEEKAKISLKMLSTLARTIDAKDRYTNGHSARVAVYATILAKGIGWDDKKLETLRYEALLHDIGKIGVPDDILNKPDRLSAAEFNLIKSHTLVGYDILKDMAVLPGAKDVAKYHHERYDGSGYPNNKAGEDIPLSARIVCIADAYDAMNSDRVYRRALPKDLIRRELIKGRGTQFDPKLLDEFLKLFDEHKLDVRVNLFQFEEADSEHESIMDDIERILRNFSEMESFNQSTLNIRDFEKFYKYMRNIGLRYNRSIEVISFKAIPKDNVEISEQEDEALAESLQYAIRKNIRAVDVYFEYTNREHIVILMDAGVDNIHVIADRVIFDYNVGLEEPKFEIQYSLNESIGKR